MRVYYRSGGSKHRWKYLPGWSILQIRRDYIKVGVYKRSGGSILQVEVCYRWKYISDGSIYEIRWDYITVGSTLEIRWEYTTDGSIL